MLPPPPSLPRSTTSDMAFVSAPPSSFVPRPFFSSHRSIKPTSHCTTTSSPILSLGEALTDPSSETQPIPTPVLRRGPLSAIIDLIRRDSGNLRYSPKYGPVYETTSLGRTVTIISDLEAITQIYRNNEVFVSSDGAWPPSMEALFGSSTLFVTEGEQHDTRRAIVQPAFSPTMFRNYFTPTLHSTYRLWDDVSQHLDQKRSVPFLPLVKDHFLRIIIAVTTGLEMNQADQSTFRRLRNLYFRFENGMIPLGLTYNNAFAAREELLAFYDDIIRERLVRDANIIDNLRASGDNIAKASFSELKQSSIDILTVAIARSPLNTGTNQEQDSNELNKVAELMLLLWFAGFSTQATTMASCVMELGFDDTIRDRLKAEQDEIMGRSGSNDVTLNQVDKEMPLLDSYINEVLRLYPAVATMPRRATRDTLVCGHLVKKDALIGLDSWWAQRDPKYFEDSQTLKIDRFMGSKAPQTVSYGAKGGAHYCIGAALAKINLKTTLAVLLREYELELDTQQTRRYVSFPGVQPASQVRVVKCKRSD